MQQCDDSNPSSNKEQQKNSSDSVAVTTNWIIIPVWIFLFVGAVLWFIARFYVNEHSVRLRFFTEAMLATLVALVAVIQTIFYYRQAKALDIHEGIFRDQANKMGEAIIATNAQLDTMTEALSIERAKTNPRLRVAEVTAENFEIGKRPFFIVTIANDGLFAATGVRIDMHIEIDNEKPMNWIDHPVVTIPANGRENYFIHSSFSLAQEQLDKFDNAAASLRVVGSFEYAPVGVTKFCYKYLSLQGADRPSKIPQFVPCDFNPRLNTTLVIPTGHFSLVGNSVSLTHDKAVRDDREETDKHHD